RPRQRPGDFLGLLRRVGDPALGHRNTEFLQQGFGLIFVDIHSPGPISWRNTAPPFCGWLRPWAAARGHRPRPVLRCGKGVWADRISATPEPGWANAGLRGPGNAPIGLARLLQAASRFAFDRRDPGARARSARQPLVPQ